DQAPQTRLGEAVQEGLARFQADPAFIDDLLHSAQADGGETRLHQRADLRKAVRQRLEGEDEEFPLAEGQDEPADEVEHGVIAVPVALDAIAAVVNKDTVTISNLSIEELARIYAGEIKNWKEVGGPDQGIVVFNRDEASGTYETFEVKVLKGGGYEFAADHGVVTSNGDMAAKVGDTPYAIGYVGLGFVSEPGLKAVTLEGVEASIDNVYNKSYPVQRYLNVVHVGELGEVEQAFVDYMLGDEGQAIVEELGFIPLP
ncbi:MAG: phosphate ABC transporter substrate-binding protein, partial [Spirochaetota bacterium]|nr:phosphate ABC transporter substrate-binding protein [Spirochaetota bacterium]